MLDQLSGQLSDSAMTNLNYQVDYLHREPKARWPWRWLRRKGYAKAPRAHLHGAAIVRLGSRFLPSNIFCSGNVRRPHPGANRPGGDYQTGLGGTTIWHEALRGRD
ncbi:MAG: hypothetical protein WKG07_11770 [Hymenobacter sp.]